MTAQIDWRPHEMPTLLINRVSRELAKIVDDALKGVGITTSQLPVLVALKDGAKLTQKELADFASVEQPSMAQLLARMERDGLIQREPSPNDGRSSLVSLTLDADSLLEPGRVVLSQIDQDACAIFTESERKLLADLLFRLVSTLTAKPNG